MENVKKLQFFAIYEQKSPSTANIYIEKDNFSAEVILLGKGGQNENENE